MVGCAGPTRAITTGILMGSVVDERVRGLVVLIVDGCAESWCLCREGGSLRHISPSVVCFACVAKPAESIQW